MLTVGDGAVRKLVTQEGPDSGPVWSPDGRQIAFQSAMASPSFFYTNNRIAVVPASGGAVKAVSRRFDEQPNIIEWTPDGILFAGLERTQFAALPSGSGDRAIHDAHDQRTARRSVDSASAATSRASPSSAATRPPIPSCYIAEMSALGSPRKLTAYGKQIDGWTVGSREMISWKSTDGTTIEGVLHKPADFQPGRKYPLLVVIHGGPTGISRPVRVQMGGVYPIEQWLAKGALVLEPNYRGSAGYGEKFRALNVRNLGVGDAWDVLSGVDHLIAQGLADKDRMGVMGWSQGGYISAFLATHERQPFKAISVGAGISNWMTYYVNTDIHPFTRQYLKATPWDDPQIYATTSPMTTIKRAKTPTLIQHGEFDTPRADAERVRAVPGPAGRRRAGPS